MKATSNTCYTLGGEGCPAVDITKSAQNRNKCVALEASADQVHAGSGRTTQERSGAVDTPLAQRTGFEFPIHSPSPRIAALYVSRGGVYSGLDGVDPWDIDRDARTYAGPYPVVAHPPCERWGRFWHGSTRKPHQFKLGDDGGCFNAALSKVLQFGGVLEHPADSHAWAKFGLPKPKRAGGWIKDYQFGGWTCCVYRGHYGHFAGKPTWLYACNVVLPERCAGDHANNVYTPSLSPGTATPRPAASA